MHHSLIHAFQARIRFDGSEVGNDILSTVPGLHPSFGHCSVLTSEAGPTKSGNIQTEKQVLPEAVKKRR